MNTKKYYGNSMIDDFNSTDEFIKCINKLRIDNKNNWYEYMGTVNNKRVILKGYNTWLQILKVNNTRINTNMSISVAEFKNKLAESLS